MVKKKLDKHRNITRDELVIINDYGEIIYAEILKQIQDYLSLQRH